MADMWPILAMNFGRKALKTKNSRFLSLRREFADAQTGSSGLRPPPSSPNKQQWFPDFMNTA
jgi:hypothetical protein